jgi:hypothetical protein
VSLDEPPRKRRAEWRKVPRVIFEGERKFMVGVVQKANELARSWMCGSYRPEEPDGR